MEEFLDDGKFPTKFTAPILKLVSTSNSSLHTFSFEYFYKYMKGIRKMKGNKPRNVVLDTTLKTDTTVYHKEHILPLLILS